jgi:hypothetical protein
MVRLPASAYDEIWKRATRTGVSVPDYIRWQLKRAVGRDPARPAKT